MRTAHLAILVSSDRRRGAEVFGETLAEAVAATGWDTDLWSLSTTPEGPRIASESLSTFTPDALPRLDRTLALRLRRRIAEQQVDLVVANGSSTLQYAAAAVRTMRHRPRLVYVSIGEPMFWVRGTRHRLVRTAILKGVDRVFSVSAVTARQLTDHLGVPPSKVRIAPTGVHPRFFAVEPVEPGPELRVVVIGNLSDEKDPLAAVEVMRRVALRTDVRARFLGGGPLQDEVAAAVTGAGLGSVVEILGSVGDVTPHLAWADVLLLTSRTEGLPGVPLEAGAAAVPSVVFDVGGASETVIDGTTGRVVPAGDLNAATDALVDLAGDRSRTQRWGEAARTMVAERFRLDDAVARYVRLCADELSGLDPINHAGGR